MRKKNFDVFSMLFIFSACIFYNLSLSVAQESEWNKGGALPYEGQKSKLVEQFPNGLIVDWGKKVAVARGTAKVAGPMSMKNMKQIERQALKDAAKKFAALIEKMRFSKKSELKHFLDKKPVAREKLKALLKESSHILDRRFLPKKKLFVVTVALDLKAVWKAVKPQDVLPDYVKTAPKEPVVSTPEEKDDKEYTSLIVDASGLGVKPSMSPLVFDETGNTVYGMKAVSEDILLEQGIVAYSDSLEKAKGLLLAGDSPLVVQAVSMKDTAFDADVVVSSKDAARILRAEEKTKILSQLKVIFVL